MTLDQFNQFCASLPATSFVEQWGRSQVWKVGGKVFAVGSLDKKGLVGITFKASDNNFGFLTHAPGYRPAPYFASRGLKWIQHYDAKQNSEEELKYYLSESYRLVVQGLSKTKRQILGLDA